MDKYKGECSTKTTRWMIGVHYVRESQQRRERYKKKGTKKESKWIAISFSELNKKIRGWLTQLVVMVEYMPTIQMPVVKPVYRLSTENPPNCKWDAEKKAKRTGYKHNDKGFADSGVERVKRRSRPIYPGVYTDLVLDSGDRHIGASYLLSLDPPSRTLASQPLITSR